MNHSKRMVSDETAKIKDFSYMAGLFCGNFSTQEDLTFTNYKDFSGSCSILSPKHLLTVAHAFHKKSKSCKVFVGESDLLFTENISRLMTIENVTIHEDYIAGNGPDLALLTLKEPIDSVNQNITPIEFYDGEVKPGMKVKSAGWGEEVLDDILSSDQLRRVQFQVETEKVCNDRFNRELEEIKALNVNVQVDESKICVGPSDTNDTSKSTQKFCGGDDVSPLVIDNKLAGIGYLTNVRCQSPTMFTRVSFYKKWIQEKMELHP